MILCSFLFDVILFKLTKSYKFENMYDYKKDKKMCHNLNIISNLSSCQMDIVQNIWFPLCLYYSYNSNMLIALVSIKSVSPVCLVCRAGVSIILEI